MWDYVLSANEAPDREIVHSHDFNRYLTPFRAEWDPKDSAERTFVVGRYCVPSEMSHQRCLETSLLGFLQPASEA